MIVTNQTHIEKCDLRQGHFNACEHLFVDIEPGRNQTISCRLPNGKYVTFCFCRGSDQEPKEMGFVDIHSTVGPHFLSEEALGRDQWQMHLVGFCPAAPDSFDTRRAKMVIPDPKKSPTTLATLLLNKEYYQ
jgi:hypothetical protein